MAVMTDKFGANFPRYVTIPSIFSSSSLVVGGGTSRMTWVFAGSGQNPLTDRAGPGRAGFNCLVRLSVMGSKLTSAPVSTLNFMGTLSYPIWRVVYGCTQALTTFALAVGHSMAACSSSSLLSYSSTSFCSYRTTHHGEVVYLPAMATEQGKFSCPRGFDCTCRTQHLQDYFRYWVELHP